MKKCFIFCDQLVKITLLTAVYYMKILIIEDSVDVLTALRKSFRNKKVITDHCTNGAEGLEKLKKNGYDLAILDLQLPDMRGEEILKKVKSLGIEIPLLILTANTDVQKRAKLLEIGAEDFIQKPFTFEELFARIQAILRRIRNSIPTEYLKVGDLELVPEKRLAIKGGHEIQLRGKEYNLLEYMMRHPDQVVSRQTLMEEVWDYSASVLSNTVDAYMYKVRQKIDKGAKKKMIRTIHGVGFMLNSTK